MDMRHEIVAAPRVHEALFSEGERDSSRNLKAGPDQVQAQPRDVPHMRYDACP
jgi:hypothetical protein